MPSSPNPSLMAMWSPVFSWSELMFKSAEMMMASGQVIGHRVQRMGQAGLAPTQRDVKEFTLMGQEKLAAASESAQAMSSYWWSQNQRATVQWMQKMTAMSTAWWGVMAAGPAGSGGQQAGLWQAWADMGKAGPGWVPWAASTTSLMNKGLLPIHSRATANARRLGSR